MKNKRVKVFIVLLMSLMLTGCWDSVEIDRKAFVSTVAVDIDENRTANNYDDKFIVTYNFPDIRKMEPSKGTTERVSLTVNGYSITDAYIKAVSTASRNLHFGHSKLLLVSKEIYDYPDVVTEFMDYLERTPEINRAMQIALVDGKANECLSVKPLLEDGVDNYISNILNNSNRNGSFKPINITNYIDGTRSATPLIVPVFKVKEDESIELSYGSAIQGDKILCDLSRNEVDDAALLRGHIGGCKKSIIMDNHPIDFYIENVRTKIKPAYDNSTLRIEFNVACDGDLSGYYSDAEALDSTKINYIEDMLNESIGYELSKMISDTINDSDTDIVGVGEYLMKYHGRIWGEVEKNWPQKLKDASISVNVVNKIKSVGISN